MHPKAAAYWQDWLDGPRDVPGLRLHTISLLMHMRQAARSEDWELFQRLLEVYTYAAEYCQGEPQLTVFENGLMHVNIQLADSMWLRGELRRAMQHLNWVNQTLAAGDLRRAESGMVPRPNSELRYSGLGIKSACCLEDAELFETDSPELETSMMASDFWRVVETALGYLGERSHPESDRARTVKHAIARWELEICKLCYRHSPELAGLAVDFFNRRIGDHLELQPKHFALLTEADSRSAWYWDFELSKLETSGDFNRTEVLLCDSARSASARLSFAKDPSLALRAPWARQVDRLLDALETS